MSTLKVSGLQDVNGIPQYTVKAWVNFDASGNIRASGGVSSVTFNGAGDYTITLSNAMPDINYAVIGMGRSTTSAYGQSWTTNVSQSTELTTTTARIVHSYQDDNSNAVAYVNPASTYVIFVR